MSDVSLVLLPRAHDVGGFEVRRALPAAERQMVGPFIFFDQMGPVGRLGGLGSFGAETSTALHRAMAAPTWHAPRPSMKA